LSLTVVTCIGCRGLERETRASGTDAQVASAPVAESGPTDTAGWSMSRFEHRHRRIAGAGVRRRWEPARRIDPQGVRGVQLMFELTRYADRAEPDEGERARADELRQRSFDAARHRGWFDYAQAQRDGYQPTFGAPLHYVNEAFVTDEHVLDPDRPEFLLFYDTEYGKRLVAVMYLARRDEHGPQIGGPLTVWHNHVLAKPRCLLDGLLWVADPDEDGGCVRGSLHFESPEMLHVWFSEHPDGPFATRMELEPRARAGFEGPEWPPAVVPGSEGGRTR